MENNKYNKKQKVQYWLNLYTFYADKACMNVTLVDEDAGVQIKISPVLPGMEGRPQAGVQKYDHQNALAITLGIHEIAAIITAFETGLLNSSQATFYHAGNSPKTGGIMPHEYGFSFVINDVNTKAGVLYSFNSTKIGKKEQPVYVPSEINLFINILKSVISNLPNIKANLYPEYVKQSYNNNNVSQQPQSTNMQYNRQVQPSMQPQQPIMQQPMVQPSMQPQQPMPQQPMVQQPSNLPQSNNIPSGMPSDDNFSF